jgi:hypothetical protein
LTTVRPPCFATRSKAIPVVEAIERGWERLANGVLLDAAEAAGFELLVTALTKTFGISKI